MRLNLNPESWEQSAELSDADMGSSREVLEKEFPRLELACWRREEGKYVVDGGRVEIRVKTVTGELRG